MVIPTLQIDLPTEQVTTPQGTFACRATCVAQSPAFSNLPGNSFLRERKTTQILTFQGKGSLFPVTPFTTFS